MAEGSNMASLATMLSAALEQTRKMTAEVPEQQVVQHNERIAQHQFPPQSFPTDAESAYHSRNYMATPATVAGRGQSDYSAPLTGQSYGQYVTSNYPSYPPHYHQPSYSAAPVEAPHHSHQQQWGYYPAPPHTYYQSHTPMDVGSRGWPSPHVAQTQPSPSTTITTHTYIGGYAPHSVHREYPYSSPSMTSLQNRRSSIGTESFRSSSTQSLSESSLVSENSPPPRSEAEVHDPYTPNVYRVVDYQHSSIRDVLDADRSIAVVHDPYNLAVETRYFGGRGSSQYHMPGPASVPPAGRHGSGHESEFTQARKPRVVDQPTNTPPTTQSHQQQPQHPQQQKVEQYRPQLSSQQPYSPPPTESSTTLSQFEEVLMRIRQQHQQKQTERSTSSESSLSQPSVCLTAKTDDVAKSTVLGGHEERVKKGSDLTKSTTQRQKRVVVCPKGHYQGKRLRYRRGATFYVCLECNTKWKKRPARDARHEACCEEGEEEEGSSVEYEEEEEVAP